MTSAKIVVCRGVFCGRCCIQRKDNKTVRSDTAYNKDVLAKTLCKEEDRDGDGDNDTIKTISLIAKAVAPGKRLWENMFHYRTLCNSISRRPGSCMQALMVYKLYYICMELTFNRNLFKFNYILVIIS